MTKLYSVEVSICATAYVKAEDAQEAEKKADEFIRHRILAFVEES